MKLSIEKLRPISIGHNWDNETGVIWVDCSEWLDKYPMLTNYAIAVTRPDGEIYFAPAVMSDEGWLEWVISAADTAAHGSGMYQIIATGADGQRRATDYFPLYIYPNMPGLEDASPEPPEAAQGWVDRVLGAAAEAKDNADAAWQGAAEANEAAAEAKAQADRAQQIVDDFSPEGSGGTGGADGGYYKPSVSPEGMLSWTPSKAGMPNVESANVRGEAGEDGKTAYQYAVEGGYAGSEAEFAAKLAEESYILPTATADVKGGVKIGDDFEMDDETLRLKDEEYELIETIVLDEAMTVIRTEEPDGTPYSFKVLYIVVDALAASVSGGNVPVIATLESGSIIRGYMLNNTATNYNKHGSIVFAVEKGLWINAFTQMTQTDSGYVPWNTNGYFNGRYPYDEHGGVVRLATNELPAGVTLKIYGVRV